MLKVRDAFFTLLVGIACIVTLFTHDRPAFFYVGRYLSAGNDPAKVSAFDRLHDMPAGRGIPSASSPSCGASGSSSRPPRPA